MEEREISWLVFVSLLFTGTGGGHPEKADPPHYVEEKEEKGIREEIKEVKVEKEEKEEPGEKKVKGVKEIMEVIYEEEEEWRTPSTIQTANLF
jgi:predicted glycosyltransferase